MKQIWLKKIRVVISLLVLFSITLLFIDFERIGHTPAATAVLYPQFIPSLLQFIHGLMWSASGFIIVLVLTILFGRVYCSMLCPLGTLQDIIINLANRFGKPRKVKFRYQKPHNALRYSILALVILATLSGSILLLMLLDPFSNFARIVGSLLRPLYMYAHNSSGELLNSFGLNAPFPLQWKAPPLLTLLFPIAFLILISWMSIKKGRLFCNTLCPVGTVLGLISRFAFFKIRIPKSACTLCAHCSINCKAGCIHLKTQEIDFSRCVACFNCITVCDAHGIGYARSDLFTTENSSNALNQAPLSKKGKKRRALLQNTALTITGWAGFANASHAAKPQNRLPNTIQNQRNFPVMPPGAGNLANFNDRCIACHLCISACPYGVLQPALLDYGLSGLLQPHLDFTAGYCSYECQRCGEVCPSGALRPLALAVKQITQLGNSKFIRANCIVYTDQIACSACADYCPTHAVQMFPYQNGLQLPQIDLALCIGCGACENACPARPYRAIYVEGHAVQELGKRLQKEPST